uniref:Uridine diphosphate glucose pyrophosphatase NUDT14 n=1 Tax=Hirondellea gigas TaxID=1518452 RepID=A0A6A7G2H3_9CRUS
MPVNSHAISDVSYGKCENSKYVKPKRMFYHQNGQKKIWDVVQCYEVVAVLVYHRVKKCFLLVKQFRPAVYHASVRADESKQSNPELGFTHELVAGLIDKEKPLKTIAVEEVEEEIGYKVSEDSLEKIVVYYAGVGILGNSCHLFYAEVDDTMKVSDGGGIDTECIEIVELPVSRAKEFALSDKIAAPAALLFAFYWWFDKFKDRID